MAPTEECHGLSWCRPTASPTLPGYSVLHKTGLRIGWSEGAAGV
jgi:hypothetical protein